jgi:hypothetical protein
MSRSFGGGSSKEKTTRSSGNQQKLRSPGRESTVMDSPPVMGCDSILVCTRSAEAFKNAIRWPFGDYCSWRKRCPAAASRSLRGCSPLTPMSQISFSAREPMNAIRLPSGDTAARPPSSRSLRGAAPKIEIAQIPVVLPDTPGPTAASLVPSRNQERLAQRKQNPSGRGRACVSPDSSKRT